MISFKPNMNNWDRAGRAAIGVTLLTLGPVAEVVTADGLSTLLLGAVGATALISALFSYCILYEISGFSTLITPRD